MGDRIHAASVSEKPMNVFERVSMLGYKERPLSVNVVLDMRIRRALAAGCMDCCSERPCSFARRVVPDWQTQRELIAFSSSRLVLVE